MAGGCDQAVLVVGWAVLGLLTIGITAFATAIVLLVIQRKGE